MKFYMEMISYFSVSFHEGDGRIGKEALRTLSYTLRGWLSQQSTSDWDWQGGADPQTCCYSRGGTARRPWPSFALRVPRALKIVFWKWDEVGWEILTWALRSHRIIQWGPSTSWVKILFIYNILLLRWAFLYNAASIILPQLLLEVGEIGLE